MNPGHQPPPREIPPDLIDEYTMGGKIPVHHLYYNGDSDEPRDPVYTTEIIEDYISAIKDKMHFHYGLTDKWMYQALEAFPVKDKSVAIMGSVRAVYESMVIHYGGNPTTIDYNPITSKDSRLQTMTVPELKSSDIRFDIAFSISSFEHDGLGRYGDPINPNGDLEAMQNMKGIVKDKGLLFLAVPLGRDTVVWNAHRIYGPLRLPKLLEGWKLLGFFPSRFPYSELKDGGQAIIVLQNAASDSTDIEKLGQRLICAFNIKNKIGRLKYYSLRIRQKLGLASK